MTGYRPEFEAALTMFAEISAAIEAKGFARPVLVGGAAVELYAGGMIATGDFDVVTARQDVFEEFLMARGFVRPVGPGHTFSGWIHPELLFGFEVVGSTLLDGKADRDRIRLVDARDGEHFAVISVEDLIADRMGQYGSGAAPEMLEQARALFSLYQGEDISYLDRRIREETLDDYGIHDLLG